MLDGWQKSRHVENKATPIYIASDSTKMIWGNIKNQRPRLSTLELLPFSIGNMTPLLSSCVCISQQGAYSFWSGWCGIYTQKVRPCSLDQILLITNG